MTDVDARRRTTLDRNVVGNGSVVAVLALAALAWFVDRPLDWPTAPGRWAAALAIVAGFVAACVGAVLRARRVQRVASIDGARVLVVHATQTGFAEEVAARVADALEAHGRTVQLVPLARLDAVSLASARIALFVVATYGDGEPPDGVRGFARRTLGGNADLARLRYAVLALGDRRYPRFCAFGRAVDEWLAGQGAQPLFPRVEVDDASDADLRVWRSRIAAWSGATVNDEAIEARAWRLVARRVANPGSLGQPVHHLWLQPADDGPVPSWEAGDIAVVRLPDGTRREYSIASLPSEGGIALLVRGSVRPDGTPGTGARWLTVDVPLGAALDVQVRANRAFRLDGAHARAPAILIGNGTGLAGLRAHLVARMGGGDGPGNWLFFGERQAAVDAFYADDLARWQATGRLRVTGAYSRDAGDDGVGHRAARVYVQHRLVEAGDDVRRWIDDGAVVLVCGSATGMGEAVHAALQGLLGAERLDALAEDGRYRRDVY